MLGSFQDLTNADAFQLTSIDGTGVTADEFQLVNKYCISLRDNKRVANLASSGRRLLNSERWFFVIQ
jgi:hypothetical protein